MWTDDFVGDRFVRVRETEWIDLATGCAAHVRVNSLAERERVGGRPLDAAGTAGNLLSDAGPLGVGAWFDARIRCDEPDVDVERWRRVGHLVSRVEDAASTSYAVGPRRVHIDAATLRAPRRFIARLAVRLRALGYVTMRGAAAVPPHLVTQLAHRHLALVVSNDADCDEARRWISRVARVSLRAHLVIDMRSHVEIGRDDGPTPDSGAVHEREPSARFARAVRAERRGRRADAERWLRAAVECARRHGDEAVLVRSATRLCGCLLDRGQWREARTIALECLAAVRAFSSRLALTRAAVEALLAAGEIDRADALRAGITTEGDLSGERSDEVLRPCVMALRFWQGRFEDAHGLARLSFEDPRDITMTGLVGWAVCDRALVSSARDQLNARGPDGDATIAAAILAALDACLSGDADDASRRGRELARQSASAGPSRAARLGMLVAAEALRCGGRDPDARRCADAVLRSAPGPLEAALAAWLRHGWRGGSDLARVRGRVRRMRAQGITRWGLGRAGMHTLHVVPALMQVMQEAEDEAAALRQACVWLREFSAVDSVLFVDVATMLVVASDGRARPDLSAPDLVAGVRGGTPRVLTCGSGLVFVAPVRYAGAMIGAVIVGGSVDCGGLLEQVALTLASIAGPALRSRLDTLALAGDGSSRTPEILGRSPAIGALRESLVRAAPTPFAVLIEGESGTGKELVARAIHRLSARRDRRFCAVNCAALTDELVESELFGSARGAFTGSVAPRAGLFEEAHGGTLFLDEVGELSPRAQAKLLRALQEREVRRLGENVPRAVDVRVVAATNLPLSEAVAHGRFREDLLFRLAVVRIQLPPLRDRIEDIPLLALACWRRLSAETTTHAMLGPDAVAALCRHRWRGNVRELQNVMAALAVSAPRRGRVTARLVHHVLAASSFDSQGATPVPLDRARSTCERSTISAALARHAGRRSLAARELGLTRQGLTKAIKRLGLDDDEETAGVA